ncbi:MAG: serine acetyltransferase [Myxococcales bacterium]|nr:serine acetyltransferase [Myxococcales bacterium]
MRREVRRHRDLETAIDEITASYDGPEEINNLESAALPNQRKVIEAFHHLLPVIFMGFYSTRALNRDNLRHELAEHLHHAHELLVDQIERAVTYERFRGVVGTHGEGYSEELALGLWQKLPELRRLLNRDVLAAFHGDPAAQSIEEVVFSYPSVMALTAHRIAHVLHGQGVPMIPRIIAEHAHATTGIDIHPGATIGEGFFMDHGSGVVIGETAVIGNDVKLYQNVTLGALSTARGGSAQPAQRRHPTLEDGVTIYSGATILGGDTVIGEGSVVGGNVWLVESLPPFSKVFGRAKE